MEKHLNVELVERKVDGMSKNTVTNWESLIGGIVSSLRLDSNGQPDVVEVPNGKISEFSLELALDIFSLLEQNFSSELVNGWVEKVRKYVEVNRSKLITTSAQRFGGPHEGASTLEAMGVLMALTALTKVSIIHFNATCTIWDALQKTYSEKQCQSRASLNLISQVTGNSQYFIGRKYDI